MDIQLPAFINKKPYYIESVMLFTWQRRVSNKFLFNQIIALFLKNYKNQNILPDFLLPIKIDNDVWIGANCTILIGVAIGNGAVIGDR